MNHSMLFKNNKSANNQYSSNNNFNQYQESKNKNFNLTSKSNFSQLATGLKQLKQLKTTINKYNSGSDNNYFLNLNLFNRENSIFRQNRINKDVNQKILLNDDENCGYLKSNKNSLNINNNWDIKSVKNKEKFLNSKNSLTVISKTTKENSVLINISESPKKIIKNSLHITINSNDIDGPEDLHFFNLITSQNNKKIAKKFDKNSEIMVNEICEYL